MSSITVSPQVMQELIDAFSALYQNDAKQLAWVANYELENLKEICVWLCDFYADNWSKAELLSEAVLCLATLRCHFEFGVAIQDEPYSGYVKCGEPPEQSLQSKIAAYSVAHPRCVPIKRSELEQCLGYLGTVQQYFTAHHNQAFFDVIWPLYHVLSEVRNHL